MRRTDAIDRALEALWHECEERGGRTDEKRAILMKLIHGGYGKLPVPSPPQGSAPPAAPEAPEPRLSDCPACGQFRGHDHECAPGGQGPDTTRKGG